MLGRLAQKQEAGNFPRKGYFVGRGGSSQQEEII
jgi:hypothetical protein